MKRFVFILGTFASLTMAYSQPPLESRKLVDSLENALATHPSDSLRSRAAYHLAEYWADQDSNKAKSYLEKGWKLAGRSHYMRACHLYYVGKVYLITAPEKSEQAFLDADSILNVHKLTFKTAYTLRAAIWYNYAVLLQRKDDTESVIRIFLEKVIPYTRSAGLYNELPRMYLSIGSLFANESEYEKAGIHIGHALSMLDSAEVRDVLRLSIYIAAVDNFAIRGRLDEAEKYHKKVPALIGDNLESLYYLRHLLNEARLRIEQKSYGNALVAINRGSALAAQLKDSLTQESFLHEKFRALYFLNRYKEARDVLLPLAEAGHTPFSRTKMIYYRNLSETYEKLGDFNEAYRWLKTYSTVADSLNEARLTEKIYQMEAKFQHAESQHEIALLKAKKTEAEWEAKMNRIFTWGLCLGCAAILVIACISAAYYRKEKRLGEQMAINHEQQVKELEQNKQLAVTKALLDGEERERKRIARDLHDGLGGMLAAVKINLSGWAASLPEKSFGTGLDNVIRQLDSSVAELRRTARNMMPEALFKFGLEAALRDQCDAYTRAGINVDFQPFDLTNTNSRPLQITVYRIVQELLSNAVRHGKATNIVVQCSQNERDFIIAVEDNGIGFDKTKLEKNDGIGLSTIKSRVSYYLGKLELISAPGEGTTVHIELHDHEEGFDPNRISG